MAKMVSGFGGTVAVNTNPNMEATGWANDPTQANGTTMWGVNAPTGSFDWSAQGVQVGVGANPNVGDLYPGAQIVNVTDKDIDVKTIIHLCKQAINLYDTNRHDKKVVATEVDKLRAKIKNGTFDQYNSEELKNIFGYILGDIVSELYQNRGNEYDDILNLIFTNFPEGTGNPIKSKYGSTSKYGNGSPYAKVISDVKRYINKNGLKFPTTVNKFLKIWENFKLNKPEFDNIDVNDLYNNFVK